MSRQDAKHSLDGDCRVIASAMSMPTALKDGFARVTQDREFHLAESGARYQETDVIVFPWLARRRLIVAGSCGEYWFVHYERGGLAHSYLLVVFRADSNGTLQLGWGGSGPEEESFEDLRSAVGAGRFADSDYF